MKILGIAMLLFSSVGISSFLVRSAESTLCRTQAWLEFMRIVRSCVENYSMSATEILNSCDSEQLWRLGYSINADRPESFAQLLSCADISDRESRAALEGFFHDFGKSYRAQQTLRCDECIEMLRTRESVLSAELPTKKKVIVSVSACVTLTALILLL